MSAQYKWDFIIWFQPNEKGKTYELESIKIRTKKITMKRAQELAIMEAEKCWPHYEIELTKIKPTPTAEENEG